MSAARLARAREEADLRVAVVVDDPARRELERRFGLVDTSLREQGQGEERGDAREVSPVLTPLERLVRLAECALGGLRVSGEKLDLAGRSEDARGAHHLETELAARLYRRRR